MLSPEIQSEILALRFTQKLSCRAIARRFSINRKTVRNVIERRSVLLHPVRRRRSSQLDPYRDAVASLVKETPDTTAIVILQRLRDQGYEGGITVLRQLVRQEKQNARQQKEAFFKMNFPPGQVAQVDWGEFGNVFGDGVKIHCFVMVLSYSRMIYLEFTRCQKFEDFIRCHQNANAYFGELVAKEYWYDNMPTVVSKRIKSIVHFNPKFLSYAGHHRFMPYACNLAKGNEKGQVENGIKYIRMNFWPNRKFKDFNDLCEQAKEWRDQIANLREHGASRKIPKFVFEHDEKKALLPANTERFDTTEEFSKKVPPNFHLIYETNQYSVPWKLVGCSVSIRADENKIQFFYQDQIVATHSRSYLKHRVYTNFEHEKGLIEIKPKGEHAHLQSQIAQLESLGPCLKQYIECLHYSPKSLRREVSQLLGLSAIYQKDIFLTEVDNQIEQPPAKAGGITCRLKPV